MVFGKRGATGLFVMYLAEEVHREEKDCAKKQNMVANPVKELPSRFKLVTLYHARVGIDRLRRDLRLAGFYIKMLCNLGNFNHFHLFQMFSEIEKKFINFIESFKF